MIVEQVLFEKFPVLSVQFGYPAWQATLYIGLVFAVGGISGSIINGCLIKKLHMKPPAMALHNIATKIAVILIVTGMIFVTCPPVSQLGW